MMCQTLDALDDLMTVPPQPTMPAVWGPCDEQGYPMRHTPAAQLGDLWEATCGAFCFEFRPVSMVIEKCRPCPQCYPNHVPLRSEQAE